MQMINQNKQNIKIFTPEFVSKLAADNLTARLAKYPELCVPQIAAHAGSEIVDDAQTGNVRAFATGRISKKAKQ